MKVAAAVDKTAASLADDEHVIVVVDSNTGEIRQCGDMSGYCVRTNPWASKGATLPAPLAVHAADLSPNTADSMNISTTNNVAVLENTH